MSVSAIGKSSRLITGRFRVRVPDGQQPPQDRSGGKNRPEARVYPENPRKGAEGFSDMRFALLP